MTHDNDNEAASDTDTDSDSVHSSWPTGSSQSPGPTPSVDSFLEGPWPPRRPSTGNAEPHDGSQDESALPVMQPSAGSENHPIDLDCADSASSSSSRSNWARGENGLHHCAFCTLGQPVWFRACGFPLRKERDVPLGGWRHEDFN